MSMTTFELAARWGLGLAFKTIAPPDASASAVRVVLVHDVPRRALPALGAVVEGLRRRGVILSPSAAADVFDGRSSRGGYLITIDDAYASSVEAVRRVLEPAGVRALVFACPALVDLPLERQEAVILDRLCLSDRSPGLFPETPRFATWDELRALASDGHEIGAHGMTHTRLAGLAPADLAAEVAACRARLADRMGRPTRWFAPPFGDLDEAAVAAIGRHFDFCCTAVRGINTPETSRLAIRRDNVDLSLPAAYHDMVLAGGFDPLYAWRRRRLDRLAPRIHG